MIKLISHEIYKIFHKKSTWILVALILIISLVSSIMNASYPTGSVSFSSSNVVDEALEEQYLNYENEIRELDLNNSKDVDRFVELNILVEDRKINKYQINGGDDILSYYNTFHPTIIRDYYETKYKIKDDDKADELKSTIDEIHYILENKDYKKAYEGIIDIFDSVISGEDNDLISLNDYYSNIDKNSLLYIKELYQYLLDNDIEANYENYLYNTMKEVENMVIQSSIDKDGNLVCNLDKEQCDRYEEEFYTYNYILENKVNINNMELQGAMENAFFKIELFIVIFIVMLSATIISSEYTKGTIKHLLILPYSRMKIILSKMICIFIMILFITLISLLGEFIFNSIIFGFDSLDIPVFIYTGNNTHVELSLFSHITNQFIAYLPMFTLLSLITMLVALISLNSSIGITIGLLIFFGETFILNSMIYNNNIVQLKYLFNIVYDYFILKTNDYVTYLGITNTFAIIMYIVYLILFIGLSIFIFNKKDTNNQ